MVILCPKGKRKLATRQCWVPGVCHAYGVCYSMWYCEVKPIKLSCILQCTALLDDL
jgi:hypothetical protein